MMPFQPRRLCLDYPLLTTLRLMHRHRHRHQSLVRYMPHRLHYCLETEMCLEYFRFLQRLPLLANRLMYRRHLSHHCHLDLHRRYTGPNTNRRRHRRLR